MSMEIFPVESFVIFETLQVMFQITGRYCKSYFSEDHQEHGIGALTMNISTKSIIYLKVNNIGDWHIQNTSAILDLVLLLFVCVFWGRGKLSFSCVVGLTSIPQLMLITLTRMVLIPRIY